MDFIGSNPILSDVIPTMDQQLKLISTATLGRYKLLLPWHCTTPRSSLKGPHYAPKQSQAHLGHMQFWGALNKITVHSTSKKLLNFSELYGCFHLALTCITCQSPHVVKSKISVASFKMMRGNVLGVGCNLRNKRRVNFCYKWSFLGPAANITSNTRPSHAVGLDNVFVFELDQLDYVAFEPLPGLDLSFDQSEFVTAGTSKSHRKWYNHPINEL
jgi:hypothetical protein